MSTFFINPDAGKLRHNRGSTPSGKTYKVKQLQRMMCRVHTLFP